MRLLVIAAMLCPLPVLSAQDWKVSRHKLSSFADMHSRSKLSFFVDTHYRAAWRYGHPQQPWADVVWTWQAMRCLDLGGIKREKPNDVARRAVAALPIGISWNRRVVRARLMRALGLPTAPPPESSTFLPATSWIGSPPLSHLEAIVELQVKGGRRPDVAMLRQVLELWRGADGGWRWPATLDETFELVRAGRDFTSLPKAPNAPSTAEASASAVSCYVLAGLPIPKRDRAISRLAALLRDDGGYRQGGSNHEASGLWATYHALRALKALGAAPPRPELTSAWIASHRHHSGGFAHTAVEPATLEATWLALESLNLLGRPLPPMPEKPLAGKLPDVDDPGDLHLYQAVVEMGPDPGTSVALARGLGAHLLLIKTLEHTERDLALRARAVAARYPAPTLEIGCVREEHLRAWGVEGVGYATHCSDVVFAPESGIGERGWYRSFQDIVAAWKPDRSKGSIVFSCSHAHRELLAPAYDRTAAGTGYDALMVGWAFAPGGDVVREHPWLARYAERTPIIGNHDAHGDPFHWLHRGSRTRTLFFAKTPDVAAFCDAVRRGRVIVVAHGPDGDSMWGHPHWTLRAQTERARWDQGRAQSRPGMIRAHTGAWLPDPVAIPIDRTTHRELPSLTSGFGVVVRTAGRLGDDALPHEVTLRIGNKDSEPIPLRMVPPMHDGPPALWAPLDVEPGEHVVRIEAFGKTTVQRVRLGRPVDPETPRPVVHSKTPPRSLRFRSGDDFPFVRHTSLAPGDFEGSVRIVCARVDLIVAAGRSGQIRIRWRGGKAAGPLRFWIDGLGAQKVFPDGREGISVIPIPDTVADRTAHRLTLRTTLPGWTQPLDRPESDLELLEVTWEKSK